MADTNLAEREHVDVSKVTDNTLAPVAPTAVAVEVSTTKTLMKTRLLEGEKFVAEFHEEPVCDNLCRRGLTRRVQLTTRRIIYYESSRSMCCITSRPTLRQVFLKDITEIAIMGYRKPSESLLTSLMYFLIAIICFPIVIILRCCRKRVPEVVFGTRCPQQPVFAIRLTDPDERTRLIEEASALVNRNM